MKASPPQQEPGVGLCSVCAHARIQGSARGRRFWRCRRADVDPRLLRYPPLPVRTCPAHEPGAPEGEAAGAAGSTG